MQTAACENQPDQVSKPRASQLKHDIDGVLASPSFTFTGGGQIFQAQYLTSAQCGLDFIHKYRKQEQGLVARTGLHVQGQNQ